MWCVAQNYIYFLKAFECSIYRNLFSQLYCDTAFQPTISTISNIMYYAWKLLLNDDTIYCTGGEELQMTFYVYVRGSPASHLTNFSQVLNAQLFFWYFLVVLPLAFLILS